MDIFHVGEFLCLSAYFLLAMGVLIGHILETDTLWLTPILPTDARKILILFSGTSASTLKVRRVQEVEFVLEEGDQKRDFQNPPKSW